MYKLVYLVLSNDFYDRNYKDEVYSYVRSIMYVILYYIVFNNKTYVCKSFILS